MDRRTFMRAAAASTGSVALAGCLGDDSEPGSELGEDGPPQYDLPPYSELTPAETHTSDGVVLSHLRLSMVSAIRAAHNSQRLPADPVVELPLSGIEPILDAVETLSTYPFAAPLRRAVNDAAGDPGVDDGTTNRTLVDTVDETVETNRTTLPVDENGTVANTTAGGGRLETGSIENGTVPNGTVENATADTSTDGETELGIEVDGIALADEVLVFQGRFDQAVFDSRYARGFQQVDAQRGVAIYENGSGQGFAVGDGLLIVPTERDSRAAGADTVLAHTLSGYVTTLDRMVDDEAGQWLFETTGPAAFSLGVWGADDPLGRVAEAVGTAPESTGPVFDSVGGFMTALEPTVDDSGAVTSVETRFAGLFPADLPAESELRSTLAGGREDSEIYRNAPQAHLTASFGGR